MTPRTPVPIFQIIRTISCFSIVFFKILYQLFINYLSVFSLQGRGTTNLNDYSPTGPILNLNVSFDRACKDKFCFVANLLGVTSRTINIFFFRFASNFVILYILITCLNLNVYLDIGFAKT